jgi:hypothetical protein
MSEVHMNRMSPELVRLVIARIASTVRSEFRL